MEKALIFGAGKGGALALNLLAPHFEVVAFVDSSPQLRGSTLQGRPVVAPEDLDRYKGTRIFVASRFKNEIVAKLSSLGVDGRLVTVLTDQVLTGECGLDGRPISRDVIVVVLEPINRRTLATLPKHLQIQGIFLSPDVPKISHAFREVPDLATLVSIRFDMCILMGANYLESYMAVLALGVPPSKVYFIQPPAHHTVSTSKAVLMLLPLVIIALLVGIILGLMVA